jgi:hypothetical protein
MTVILLKTFGCIKELGVAKSIGQEPLFASGPLEFRIPYPRRHHEINS